MPGRVLVVDDSPTIRKIVHLILQDAGFDVTEAADGQRALEHLRRDSTFDVVLLDFVMPRMNGYQLAQALRSDQTLRSIPVVLMSAKAGVLGDRFLRQTGAVDAISKPFSPDALVAVVGHAVNRSRGAAATSATLVNDALAPRDSSPPEEPQAAPPKAIAPPPNSDSVTDSTVRERVPKALLTTEQSALATPQALFADALADTVTALLTRLPELNVLRQRKFLTTALIEMLDPARQRELVERARALLGEGPSTDRDVPAKDPPSNKATLEADLSVFPVGDLLQMLRHQQQTGLVVLRRARAEVVIALREGYVDVAIARGISSEFLLGRYLIASGVITREALDEALRAPAKAERPWLGERLLAAGTLTQEQLNLALERQTSEIIYEVVRWPDGRYHFEHNATIPEGQRARLGLPPESLVLEGFRRVDEWRLIEEEVHSFDEVFALDQDVFETVGTARLSEEERSLLDHVDGQRTVRDIVMVSGKSSFETCKVLHRLRRSRILRRRSSA